MKIWKVKYYTLSAVALLVNSDRLWEKAWAYGFHNTMGRRPTKSELDRVFRNMP